MNLVARPKAKDPLRPVAVRLGQRHKDIVHRIMQAKGIKDPSKAHRFALEFTDSILHGMGGKGMAPPPSPAPATVPPPQPMRVADIIGRVPAPEPAPKVRCPACGNEVPESWLHRRHRVYGKTCEGVP